LKIADDFNANPETSQRETRVHTGESMNLRRKKKRKKIKEDEGEGKETEAFSASEND